MADLRDRIESEYEAIRQTLDAMPSGRLADLSALELAGAAALLHNFYNGVENVIKQVFLAKNLVVPDGPAWHRDLLTTAVERGILSEGNVARLRPFLAFRHFFSHAYAFDLDAQRMEPLVHDAEQVFQAVSEDIAGMI